MSVIRIVESQTTYCSPFKTEKGKENQVYRIFTHSNMAGLIKAASESEMWDVILTSYNFRLPNIGEMNEAIEKAASSGIGIIAMKTLAGGAFLDRKKQDR
jgi:predicted aldo/keto reductase-like oxidoreductase